MEKAAKPEKDRFTSTGAGERPVGQENSTEQSISPKDGRIVSTNQSVEATTAGTSRDVTRQPALSDAGGVLSTVYPLDVYASQQQSFYYGGYDNSSGGYSHINADGLQVISPVFYNDPSLVFETGYGFNPELAYGQYSSIAAPMPPVMMDGQLYSPQQFPFSPPYYPQPVAPSVSHIPSAVPFPQTELLAPESSGQDGVSDNMLFGPGSGYFVHYGPFGGGDLSGNPAFYTYPGELGSAKPFSNAVNGSEFSPLTSPAAYPLPVGLYGSYEQNAAQRPMHGYGLVPTSSGGPYSHGGSYPASKQSSASTSRLGANDRNRVTLDKVRRRERDRDSICIPNDSDSADRNRGPRASKPKGKSISEEDSLPGISKNGASTSGVCLDSYNQPGFMTEYENAKFFIIKSFSEDNVHKSIKYNVWASTPLGNRKLDAAYHEAKEEKKNSCPVFLLFSVNASAQFCGIAEMVGPVDFDKDADYWQQDRWSGQFPVQWHIIKDVPNGRFRHILLENNENKPVTHSRDTQEVKLEQGIEMLKIFKNYEARTSMLDDFEYYDERETVLLEKKARQKATLKTATTTSIANDTAKAPTEVTNYINKISDNFAQALKLEENTNSEEVASIEKSVEDQN